MTTAGTEGTRRLGEVPIVDLWSFVGLGLIIAHPSGIIYSNQVGGTQNDHPQLEGIFVPIGNAVPADEDRLHSPQWALQAYFEGPKYSYGGARNGLDQEDADFIDNVLTEFGLAEMIEVDRDRLGSGNEAWVPVAVRRPRLVSGLGDFPRQGVITWCNTD